LIDEKQETRLRPESLLKDFWLDFNLENIKLFLLLRYIYISSVGSEVSGQLKAPFGDYCEDPPYSTRLFGAYGCMVKG
jgi:hypothetical protein